MSFISSKTDKKYVESAFASCLDVSVESGSATLAEGFVFSELEALRDQLIRVVEDIDYLFECKKEIDYFNQEQFGSSEGR